VDRREPQRDVGLAAGDIERAIAPQEIDHQIGVLIAQREQPFGHQERRKRFGRRQPAPSRSVTRSSPSVTALASARAVLTFQN